MIDDLMIWFDLIIWVDAGTPSYAAILIVGQLDVDSVQH